MAQEYEDKDSEFENLDATEGSEDFGLGVDDFADLVISPADWTIETLYSLIERQIDLGSGP